MPNGHQEARDRVWRASRFWGVVWQVGDSLYYVGLLGSVAIPVVLLVSGIYRFETWGPFLRRAGLSVGCFFGCFPLGLVARGVLQGLAEQGAGVE